MVGVRVVLALDGITRQRKKCAPKGHEAILAYRDQAPTDGSENLTGFSAPMDVWNVRQKSLFRPGSWIASATALTVQQSMVGNERLTRPPRIGFVSHSFYEVLCHPVLRSPLLSASHLFVGRASSAPGRSALIFWHIGGRASNCILCVTMAQAIRASLLANAQATTFEGRRTINERTHSASDPFLFPTLTI